MTKPLPLFRGEIKNGKLELKNPVAFQRYVGTLRGEVELTLAKRLSTRSLLQNNYYWGAVLKTISDNTGFTENEVHEVMKKKFLFYFKKYKGKEYRFTKSTAKLSSQEFSEYIEKIKQFVSLELNCRIPEAGEIVIDN